MRATFSLLRTAKYARSCSTCLYTRASRRCGLDLNQKRRSGHRNPMILPKSDCIRNLHYPRRMRVASRHVVHEYLKPQVASGVCQPGLSGNGKGEPELAELAAQISAPACLVIDYEANCGGPKLIGRPCRSISRLTGSFIPRFPSSWYPASLMEPSRLCRSFAKDGSRGKSFRWSSFGN